MLFTLTSTCFDSSTEEPAFFRLGPVAYRFSLFTCSFVCVSWRWHRPEASTQMGGGMQVLYLERLGGDTGRGPEAAIGAIRLR